MRYSQNIINEEIVNLIFCNTEVFLLYKLYISETKGIFWFCRSVCVGVLLEDLLSMGTSASQ